MVKDKINILYVNGGLMDAGGISAYMMNYYRHFDLSKIHIDFLTQGVGKNMFVEEIENNGSKLFQIPNKSINPIKNYLSLKSIIKQGSYDIVHSHADAGNALVLKIAKNLNVPVRISHSHNTDFIVNSRFKKIINEYEKNNIKKYATHLWGCSLNACKWLYNNDINNVEVIHNAIDTSKFLYNEDKRLNIRKSLEINNNTIAICQIGHLCDRKNQVFSIKVIKKIKELYKDIDVKLFLIGDGEDKNKIINLIKELNLKNNVILLGIRNDIADLIQGMDIMLLPSLFEGFPVTLVESQTNSLFSIVSDKVSKEVIIDDSLIKFLPIEDGNIIDWANECVSKYNKRNMLNIINKEGFNIELEALKLQNKYIELINND